MASTPLVGLDEAPETDAEDAAELHDSLEASSEPLAEPWQATIAAGETLANGASSQDSSPGNAPEIGEPTPSPAESAPSPDLGLELVGGIEATWGPTNAPSFFNNDIRL
jgi:hypothetical protein